jgi:MoaA/NifB/PqqE/SkfB family radical SAM enzyme
MSNGFASVSPENIRARSIDIYINSVCNLKCRTCFLGDTYFGVARSMSVDVVEEILSWAAAIGINDVAILGGEPTLHRSISRIARLPKEKGIKSTRLVTNGNRRFLKLLPSLFRNIDTFYVSLDGANEHDHDLVRGTGSFKDVMNSLAALEAIGASFVVTSTVSRLTVGSVMDIVALSENCGASRLNLHWLSPVGRAKNASWHLSPEEWLDLCAKVSRYRSKRPTFTVDCQRAFVAKTDPVFDFLSQQCAVRDLGNLQFMPDGGVVSCGLLVDCADKYGYEWSEGSLLMRGGNTEVTQCRPHCRGCPVRVSWQTEESGLVPVCIYHRQPQIG